MLKLQDALERILSEIQSLPAESMPLGVAADRFVAEPVVAAVDLPGFDNSAMDGYAVRAEDVRGATREKPASLRLAGRVPAGERRQGTLSARECIRLFTGSPMPKGADAVVMQEDTHSDPRTPDEVQIVEPVKPWENVRFQGEDIKKGDVLVEKGDKLSAGRLALIGATGIATVRVGRKPVVGVLATGTELREPGSALEFGQIYESNRVALGALITRAGCQPHLFPLVPDSLEATRAAMRQAFDQCDAVVTSGGVSVGEFDFVKEAMEALEGTLSFWRVAIKPGKPFVFGRCGVKPFFGLPGNPVSALVTFVLLARPALLRLQMAREIELPSHSGILVESLSNRGDRPHFFRVTVDSSGNVRSAGTQASHVLRSLASANGLIEVAPESTLQAGAVVRVLRWD